MIQPREPEPRDEGKTSAAASGAVFAQATAVLAACFVPIAAFLWIAADRPATEHEAPRSNLIAFPYDDARQLPAEAEEARRDAPASSPAGSTLFHAPAEAIEGSGPAASRSDLAAVPAPEAATLPPVPNASARRPAPAEAPPLSSAFPSESRWEWAELWSRPAEYVVAQTWLASPAELKYSLSQPEAAGLFLSRPLVRAALASPSMAGLLMENKTIVRAVLNSPAMRDPAAVEALLASRIGKALLESPAAQAFLKDPGAMLRLFADPEVLAWLRGNSAAAARLPVPPAGLARIWERKGGSIQRKGGTR